MEGEWLGFAVLPVHLARSSGLRGLRTESKMTPLLGRCLGSGGGEVTANYNVICNIMTGIDPGGPRVMGNV